MRDSVAACSRVCRRHGKQWQLRFLAAPTEQIRVHFKDAPKPKAYWDPTSSRSDRTGTSKPQSMSDRLVAATKESSLTKGRHLY
jgi:hypothetical protein